MLEELSGAVEGSGIKAGATVATRGVGMFEVVGSEEVRGEVKED